MKFLTYEIFPRIKEQVSLNLTCHIEDFSDLYKFIREIGNGRFGVTYVEYLTVHEDRHKLCIVCTCSSAEVANLLVELIKLKFPKGEN